MGPVQQLNRIVSNSMTSAWTETDASVACDLWKQALAAQQQIIVYDNQCDPPSAIISAATARSFAKEVNRACTAP
jgi:hypothetical protein